jgi:hypothetical protein
MLGKLPREHRVTPDQMLTMLDAGASRTQIEDALAVCFAFVALSPCHLAHGADRRQRRAQLVSRICDKTPICRNACSSRTMVEPARRLSQ